MNNNINLNNQKFELNQFIKDISTACVDVADAPTPIIVSCICNIAFHALCYAINTRGAHHGSNIVGKYELAALGLAGLADIILLCICANAVRKSYNKIRNIEDFISQRTSFPDNTRPNMLVLTATYDHNGSLRDPLKLEKFLKLGKKFNIVFKKVALINDITANLAENSIIKKIDVLWIKAHGSPSGIALSQSEGSKVRFLSLSNLNAVAAQIKTSLSPQGTIILDSCDTAKKPDEYSESFAGALSSLSDRKVVAANQLLYKTEIHTMDPLEVKLLTRKHFLYQDCTVVINPSRKEKAN